MEEVGGCKRQEGRKEGRKVEREGEGTVSYVPASYMCACQSEGLIGVDTISECSQYVLHRHSYTHVHIHGEAEEWHDQASAAKGNYSQPLSVYKYVHTHNYVQLLTHVAGLSLYLGVC